MPVLKHSDYKAPVWLPGGHSQTMYPPLFRRVAGPPMRRERLELPDGDFLDVDFSISAEHGRNAAERLVILSHGLEGHSRRKYIKGMAEAFWSNGWDVAAWNFRGCGDGPNRLPRMYHSGDTGDLRSVINRCLAMGYATLALVGFSMGANQIFKYLGDEAASVPPQVACSVGFSMPCDLEGCAAVLARPANRVYMVYFLRTLRRKVRIKNERLPGVFDLRGLDAMQNFKEFDDRFTAPLHGFASAEDYWRKSSSLQFLPGVKVPSLIVNASNDPFLSPGCFPVEIAARNPALHLEMPERGGHVGFPSFQGNGVYWSESRALRFVESVTGIVHYK